MYIILYIIYIYIKYIMDTSKCNVFHMQIRIIDIRESQNVNRLGVLKHMISSFAHQGAILQHTIMIVRYSNFWHIDVAFVYHK